ncbi:maestro heat-like repeat-containing protein family member 2B, partial [Dromaius novaehollandiae]|uniref:maestro heat-like repeat-containing protein family member 2B n=1 Tax=Dromaius novaehollandiae TaxID=8790 RepID=UPI00311F0BE0
AAAGRHVPSLPCAVCPQGSRAETYRELESVLWGDESHLQSSEVDRVIAVALEDLRAAQGGTASVRTAASDVLVALARSHLCDVVSALQGHLKALEETSEEFVLITLRNLATRYALQCVPFAATTLSALRGVLSEVGSGRMLCAVCGVLEQWCSGISMYFREGEKGAFPRLGPAQLCAHVYPLFCYVSRKRRCCEEEEVKQAVLRAMGAMMGVLLHVEEHREHAWEHLLWLLHQYREVWDPFGVTVSLGYFLGAVADIQTRVPRARHLAIATAVHQQLCDEMEPPSPEHRAELCRCMVLQARICPEETIEFLYYKLRNGSKADRVAAVAVLQALVRSDAPDTREKLPLFAKLVQSVCHDPAAQLRRAVLHFIGELLRSSALGCSAWDVVGHLFSEFSRASGRLAMGNLSMVEAREERAVQSLCAHVLGTLDVSAGAVAKLLWPKLLWYVVPAKYTGMMVPLCRCLRSLAERRDRAEQEQEEAAPEALESEEPAALPAPQALLARLLVVAAVAPHAGGGRGAAALQLLQALPGTIHGAVGAKWAADIPLLLQHLAGTTASSLDVAEWESLLLKFLQTSLELIASEAWTVGLSQELSRQLGSSPRLSWEKRFLYKALGTALAACGCLHHVQEQTLEHLKAANFLELWQAQGMVSVVSRCAESHFQLALSLVKEFTGTLKRKKSKARRTRATRAALLVMYGRMALRAPREQLLARVERDVVANVLQLYREGCQDAQLKLSLVQSVTEISLAIQAAGAGPRFELCCKRELLQTLLEVIQEEPQESPVHPRALVAMQQLSKLKPRLSREENRHLLAQCCQGIVCLRRPEQMERRGQTAVAASCSPGVQALSLRALGQLMGALLWAELAPIRFEDMVQVLRRWLTSAHACERERALQVCVQVLGSYEERCEHRVSGDPMHRELCRGRACEWFGSLAGLLGPLTCDTSAASRWWAVTCLGHLLRTGAENTDVAPWTNEIGRLPVDAYLPGGLRRANIPGGGAQTRAPPLHLPAEHPAERSQVLCAAGRVPPGPLSPTAGARQPPPGVPAHGQITHALCEVVSVLQRKTLVQRLLPYLLPGLLRQVSETLGEELAPSIGDLESADMPGSLFVAALELVLARCLDNRWLRLLREQGAWASLAEPRAHSTGVCLLASMLLRAELVPQRLLQSLFPWLDSPSANLRLTATAFFAELMKDKLVEERKLLKPLLEALGERARDPVSTVRQMAVRGLGNAASGAPAKLRRHGAAVVSVLLRGLEDAASTEVAAESLLVLAKVLGLLEARAVGSAFEEITRASRAFWGAEEEVLRCSAFVLYGTLASSASGRRSFFSREVEAAFPSLVLHLGDPAPAVCSACKVSLHLCAPFLGSKRVRQRIAAGIGLSAAELQDEICRHLAQDCPTLLERLWSTARSCCMGSCVAPQAAAVHVLGLLLDTVPTAWLQQQDLAFLSGGRCWWLHCCPAGQGGVWRPRGRQQLGPCHPPDVALVQCGAAWGHRGVERAG